MSQSPSPPTSGSAPAPYTPSGAAASERMLSSVLGRVTGSFGAPIGRSLHFADRLVGGIVDGAGPTPGRGPAQRLFAQPVFGPTDAHSDKPLVGESKTAPTRRERLVPTQDLLTASPEPKRGADLKLPRLLRPTMALSSPERMFGNKSASDDRSTSGSAQGSDGEHGSVAQPVLSSSWEPQLAHSALELGKNPDAPLWGSLQRPTLEPLIAAVEADLVKPEPAPPPVVSERRDSSTTRSVAPTGPKSAITEEQAHRMAVDSSKRLMEAVRAHAMANSGSDDRISLGDMALISFADSNNQMAAASSYTSNAPDHQPPSKALGQMPHPRINETRQDLHKKLHAMAKLVVEDLKQVQKLSKERFG